MILVQAIGSIVAGIVGQEGWDWEDPIRPPLQPQKKPAGVLPPVSFAWLPRPWIWVKHSLADGPFGSEVSSLYYCLTSYRLLQMFRGQLLSYDPTGAIRLELFRGNSPAWLALPTLTRARYGHAPANVFIGS